MLTTAIAVDLSSGRLNHSCLLPAIYCPSATRRLL